MIDNKCTYKKRIIDTNRSAQFLLAETMSCNPFKKKPPTQNVIGRPKQDAIQILIGGEVNVGKTTAIQRMLGIDFEEISAQSTVVMDMFSFKMRPENQAEEFKGLLIDTAGQEKFHALPTNLFGRCHAFILVYDVTNLKTLVRLRDYWVKELILNHGNPTLFKHILIIGNKSDLDTEIDEQLIVQRNLTEAGLFEDIDTTLKQFSPAFTICKRFSAKTNSRADCELLLQDLVAKIAEKHYGIYK